ncbi:hypothetical protein TNCV_3724441 [Trichonephila clavipes]|nr:hypothetical protein TNCV_3724441 [Trichonephila clavipes]
MLCITRQGCHKTVSSTVTTLPWSARSLNLSPIEHIWDHLGWRVRHHMSSNEEEESLKKPCRKSQSVAYRRRIYVYVDFLEVGTINATWYCDTLSKLKEVIRKKRHGLLKSIVSLLDDNARPQ